MIKPRKTPEFSIDQLRKYKNVPVKMKFRNLEQLNRTLNRLMSKSSKEAWKKLREKGF